MTLAERESETVLRAEDVPQGAQRERLELLAAVAKAVCGFCLTHRGRCFPAAEWPGEKVYQYVCWHLLNGNVFLVRDKLGGLGGVLFAWPDRAAEVLTREALGTPHFDWTPKVQPGDAVMIAQVIGAREMGYAWRKALLARWPDLAFRRVFTWRRGRLHELQRETVKRFCRKASHGQS